MLRSYLMITAFTLAGLSLASCTEDPLPPPPNVPAQTSTTAQQPAATETPELPSIGPKAQTSDKAQIDWASAREDLQANSDGTVTIQQAGDVPASVPVLLPTGIVIAQSADSGPVYRRTPDGYFAFYPGAEYNIIVNGTNQTVEAAAIAKTNAARAPVFSSTVAGAQVWLTRYGADYTVEFECNTLADEDSTCIGEDAALEIADNLIVSGSR